MPYLLILSKGDTPWWLSIQIYESIGGGVFSFKPPREQIYEKKKNHGAEEKSQWVKWLLPKQEALILDP